MCICAGTPAAAMAARPANNAAAKRKVSRFKETSLQPRLNIAWLAEALYSTWAARSI
jgi:hypothetical protein